MNNFEEQIEKDEQVYNESLKKVNEQRKELEDVAKRVQYLQKYYFQSVIQTAVLSEKLRRRKEKLIKGLLCVGISVTAVIILFCNLFIGVLWGSSFIIAAVIIQCQTSKEISDYNGRKLFFDKYASELPRNVNFRWKELEKEDTN